MTTRCHLSVQQTPTEGEAVRKDAALRKPSRARRTGRVVGAALAASLLLAPAAMAGSGSSSSIYSCKGSYSGGSAWGNCTPAGKSMYIKILGDCSGLQSGYSTAYKWVTQGSTYTPYATAKCIWNVTSIAQQIK